MQHDSPDDTCRDSARAADDVTALPIGEASTRAEADGHGPVASGPLDAVIAVPDRIGDFSIDRIIGIGGMGAVYEGQHATLGHRVALKVLAPGKVDASALRRLEFEARTLARLRHPNIARFHEAGLCEVAGMPTPFVAMEFVPNARPLTTYANARRLDTRERVELFCQVCDAIHHAHQKGVIHRDLKPANILVDGDGIPKVIDFGIARTNDAGGSSRSQATDYGTLLGTIQYMSPEQCEPDLSDLDTRCDVYTLGVILFELLCDALPYETDDVALPDAIAMIQHRAPARPRSERPDLDVDLEIIILRALEKERDRRYRSAAELGDDLDRFLCDEPIVARRPSITYQFRKFARRHRGIVATSSVAGVLLVASTIALAVLTSRLSTALDDANLAKQEAFERATDLQEKTDEANRLKKAARDSEQEALRLAGSEKVQREEAERLATLAERERRILERVAAFMTDDFLVMLEPNDETGRAVLSQALEVMSERLGDGLQDDPRVEAELRRAVGVAFMNVGREVKAREQFVLALAGIRTLPADDRPDGLVADLRALRAEADKRFMDAFTASDTESEDPEHVVRVESADAASGTTTEPAPPLAIGERIVAAGTGTDIALDDPFAPLARASRPVRSIDAVASRLGGLWDMDRRADEPPDGIEWIAWSRGRGESPEQLWAVMRGELAEASRAYGVGDRETAIAIIHGFAGTLNLPANAQPMIAERLLNYAFAEARTDLNAALACADAAYELMKRGDTNYPSTPTGLSIAAGYGVLVWATDDRNAALELGLGAHRQGRKKLGGSSRITRAIAAGTAVALEADGQRDRAVELLQDIDLGDPITITIHGEQTVVTGMMLQMVAYVSWSRLDLAIGIGDAALRLSEARYGMDRPELGQIRVATEILRALHAGEWTPVFRRLDALDDSRAAISFASDLVLWSVDHADLAGRLEPMYAWLDARPERTPADLAPDTAAFVRIHRVVAAARAERPDRVAEIASHGAGDDSLDPSVRNMFRRIEVGAVLGHAIDENRLEDAAAQATVCIGFLEEIGEHDEARLYRSVQAAIADARGRHAEAADLARELLDAPDPIGASDGARPSTIVTLATALVAQGRFEEARTYLAQVPPDAALSELVEAEHQFARAACLLDAGRPTEAAEVVGPALETILSEGFGVWDERACRLAIDIHDRLGRSEDVETWQRRLDELATAEQD